MLSRKEIEAIEGPIQYASDSRDNSEDEATNNLSSNSMDGHITAVPTSSSERPPRAKKLKATPSAAQPHICDRDQHQLLGETETDFGLQRILDGSEHVAGQRPHPTLVGLTTEVENVAGFDLRRTP